MAKKKWSQTKLSFGPAVPKAAIAIAPSASNAPTYAPIFAAAALPPIIPKVTTKTKENLVVDLLEPLSKKRSQKSGPVEDSILTDSSPLPALPRVPNAQELSLVSEEQVELPVNSMVKLQA